MKKRAREAATPEITPLIDVVFLLLIFFMVSTVFKTNELALLLSLPEASQGEQKNPQEGIFIELTNSELAFNGRKVTMETINPLLQNIKEKERPIELRIDKEVKYQRVVDLLDRLKKFQLSNIELVTNQ